MFTLLINNYISLQDDQNTTITFDGIVNENTMTNVTVPSSKQNGTFEILYTQMSLTKQPRKIVQIQYQSLEDMNKILQYSFMQQDSEYNAAKQVIDEEKFQVTLYIEEVVASDTLYKLILQKDEQDSSEINIQVYAAQEVIIQEEVRILVEKQILHGYYKPTTSEQQILMEFSNITGAETIQVYISQTQYLPTQNDSIFNKTLNVVSGTTQSIRLDNVTLDYTQPIFITISTNSPSTQYLLMMGKEGTFVSSINEDERLLILMPYGQTQKYKFSPHWQTYLSRSKVNPKTLLQIEMNNQMLKTLVEQNVDIKGYASRLVSPEAYELSHTFTLKKHAIVDDENLAVVKHLEFMDTPYESDIYMTFTCEGENCSSIQHLEFNITINTMTQIEQYSITENQYVQFRDDGKPQNFYFETQDFMDTKIDILPAINRNPSFSQTISDCSQVKYKAIACIGVYPDQILRDNLDISRCFEEEQQQIDNETKIQITIDTKMSNYGQGTVFVRLEPDYSSFFGNQSQVSQCYSQVNLYNNIQIKDIGDPTILEVFAGYGELKATHVLADIPIISNQAAKTFSNGTKQYGDRLFLKWKADHAIHVCISDQIQNYYPFYTENNNTCNLYYNQEGTAQVEQIIEFQNYGNNKMMGGMSSTRIYISLWTRDDIPDGRILKVSLIVAPQYYTSIDTKPQSQFFGSSYQNMNYKYINFAFDIEDRYEEAKQGAIIVGPDCQYGMCQMLGPEAFYEQNIVSYGNPTERFPNATEYIVKRNNKGLQVLPVQDIIYGLMTIPKTIYVTIRYRKADGFQFQKTGQSTLSYSAFFYPNYDSSNELIYQEKRHVEAATNETNGSTIEDEFYLNNPYTPSEIVISPCRGTQKLYINDQAIDNYSAISPVEPQQPGHASYFTLNNETQQYVNQFIKITGSDVSEYELFFGNQAHQNTPGNEGQITILDFKPSSNTLRLRIAPARTPVQQTQEGGVKYYIYVVPYAGSFDIDTDYSPYTKCGIDKIGYSVYKDENGSDAIIIDEDQINSDGYITIEANQNLYQGIATQDSVLYVQVFANETPYNGSLVGDSSLQTSQLVGITVGCVIAVIAVLLLIFFILHLKTVKNKNSGYNEVQI